VAEIEGENGDNTNSEDKLGNAFAALIIDTNKEVVKE